MPCEMELPDYLRVEFSGVEPELLESGVLTESLATLGFEGFEERSEENQLLGYIRQENYSQSRVAELLSIFSPSIIATAFDEPWVNWNAASEAAFHPLLLEGDLGSAYIRANFHTPRGTEDLIITPRMSFGTGHHATTALVGTRILSLDLTGRVVLDMGCGTGIQALLAARQKAEKVYAIDNDPWAFENASENITINNASNRVKVLLGDFSSIPHVVFDVIVANLTFNLLKENLDAFTSRLAPSGLLITSGYLLADKEAFKQAAISNGYLVEGWWEQNDWLCHKLVLRSNG